MDIENSEIKQKFLHAVAGDTPIAKLWKYRCFLKTYPQEARLIKDRMLDLALRNKLLGEYEAVQLGLGVPMSSIPREGDYDRFKNEAQAILNKNKVEASTFESLVFLSSFRINRKMKSKPTSNLPICTRSTAIMSKANSITLRSCAGRAAHFSSGRRTICPLGPERSSLLSRILLESFPVMGLAKTIRNWNSSQSGRLKNPRKLPS